MTSAKKTMTVNAGNATANVTAEVNDTLPAISCPEPAGYKYVGARYVPVFAEPLEWNSNTTYEPLTIVVNDGNSYTSKTFVPAGIEISNTDYWALTGNYNAQVEQYREEVKGYSEQIAQANENAQNALTEVGSYAYLKQHRFNKLGWIGDSYSDPAVTAAPWVQQVARIILGSWPEEANFCNAAKAGAGFVGSEYAPTFLEQLNTVHSAIPDADCIVLYGGANDVFSFTTATHRPAIKEFFSTYKTLYPNTPLHIFGYNSTTAPIANVFSYHNWVTSEAKDAYVRFTFHNVTSIITDSQFYKGPDDLHPNNSGCGIETIVFTSCLTGGEAPVYPTVFKPLQAPTGATIDAQPAILAHGELFIPQIKITTDDTFTGSNLQIYSFVIGGQSLMGYPIPFEYSWFPDVNNSGGCYINSSKMQAYTTANKTLSIPPQTIKLFGSFV